MTKTNADHPDSFFKLTRPYMIMAQVLSLFPNLCGLFEPSYQHLSMCFKNWKSVYSAVIIFYNVLFLYAVAAKNITVKFSFDILSALYFYAIVFAIILSLNGLGSRWISLCREFANMEDVFQRHGYPQLRVKFFFLFIFYGIGSVVEHYLGVYQGFLRIQPCVSIPGDIFLTIEAFCKSNFSSVFSVVGYNFYFGCSLLVISLIHTCCWNFINLILIMLAAVISSRFGQLNNFLLKHQGQNRSSLFWRRVREEYTCLSLLMKKVDKAASLVVVVAYLSDIVIICKQLLRGLGLHAGQNSFQLMFIYWSTAYFLFRLFIASICMAEVNLRGKQIKSVIYSIPSQSYCDDAERLLSQVAVDDLGFSAGGFFTVTREALVKILGTILSCEVILLQFNSTIGTDRWPTTSNKTGCFNRYA